MKTNIELKTSALEFRTGNFALVAALLTAGFPWLEENTPCHNVYTDPARPKRDKSGRLEQFGAVTFYLSQYNDSAPLGLDDALSAYDGDSDPGAALDALLAGEGDVDKADVLELLQAAYVQCSKNTLANLQQVKRIPHTVPAHIRFRKPDGLPVTVSENFDQEQATKWGIDMGRGV